MKDSDKKNKLHDVYRRWLHNIIDDIKKSQEDKVMLLNEHGWYPTLNKVDDVLKHYYMHEYMLRNIKYYKHHVHTYDVWFMTKIYEFLNKYEFTSYFVEKYREKLKLHYSDIKL